MFVARYTYLDTPFGRTQVPFSKGVEVRVVIAGIASGSVRSIIETPLEYAKVSSLSFLIVLFFRALLWLIKTKYKPVMLRHLTIKIKWNSRVHLCGLGMATTEYHIFLPLPS